MECPTGKRPFRSAKAAKEANRTAGFRLYTYHCDQCGWLHVSNGEKNGRRGGEWMPNRRRGTDRRHINRRSR